ncbi:MAG: Murein hydrolase activator NlpD [Rhodanobacteraceae bacterium]|jgi:lipoprotein NlpD|nr:MAG: Murein hydrolase activator NlpD [Rhodanobacteraceae bacterium]
MRNPISYGKLLATVAALLWLAGCASTPAPVVNHSFNLGQPAPAQAPASSAEPATSNGGVQTFGLGGHANGTVGTSGYTVARGDTLYSIAFAHGMDVRELAAINGIPSPYTIHPGQVLKLKPASASPAPTGAVAAGTSVVTTTTTAAPPAATQRVSQQPSAPVFGPVTTQTLTAQGVAPAESSSAAAAPAVPTSAPAVPVASVPPPPAQTPPAPPAAAATPTPPAGATRNVAGIVWQWPASGKVVGGFQAGSGGDGAGLDIAGNVGDPVRAAASGTVVYSGNGLIGYGELIIIKHNDTYLSAYGHNSRRLVKEGDRVSAGQEIALMGASGAPRVELHFEIRKDGKPVDPLAYLPQR